MTFSEYSHPLTPAKAGVQSKKKAGHSPSYFVCWIPAFAGMSGDGFASRGTGLLQYFALAAVMLFALFLSACAPDAERTQSDEASGPEVEVVRGLMTAFNDHDADKMRTFWTDDVTWIEITGRQSTVVTDSAQALYDELVVYFEAYPDVSSSLEKIAVNGNYLTAIERPVWLEDGERKSQASIVVYEFEDGKVRRFWYYPAQ